jgi:hypothetical protein
MHQDIDMSNVFLTQFHGLKRVVLFPPDQSDLLYRLPFNVHSIADIDHPDYDQFPGLKYAKGMSTLIEHGDTIFMPSGYWHHIEYVTGGFGLALRTMANTIPTLSKGIWHLSALRITDNIMRKINDKKWFEYKRNLAMQKAEKAMEKFT